ncbi:uncharacterized protein [Drosophila virilis]|uniref:uncharacterized protein n=1 Tax=Drosophila virilis TaxID=7244 RepID=UPI0038B25065
MAVFVCFATKAVHFELVKDLSTASFWNALKRFISTQGRPSQIWSDNATNFVGTKNELLDLKQDPADLDVLTPAHFLIGEPSSLFFEPDVTHLQFNRLDGWQRVTYLQQLFWSRWREEYLTLLQQCSKWRTPKPGLCVNDIVLVKNENLPPLRWPLARITEVHVGKDEREELQISCAYCP